MKLSSDTCVYFITGCFKHRLGRITEVSLPTQTFLWRFGRPTSKSNCINSVISRRSVSLNVWTTEDEEELHFYTHASNCRISKLIPRTRVRTDNIWFGIPAATDWAIRPGICVGKQKNRVIFTRRVIYAAS